ncbi:hypothetical protein [Microbulbifer sp. JMSA008]|uniref:hypothetical protein n=1 Tax=Microbulbifer sp. JMSA008 TaxID=3243373 RepID=UPI004039DAE2
MDESSSMILREILAVLCFVAAVVFALISMKKDGREHFLRVCALFLVGVVTLFANSPYTYFASVFIIATAVTQLEFLQNLAAIIRGSKEYFDYQKETQSRSDVKRKIDQELIEEEVAAAESDEDDTDVAEDNRVQATAENVMLNLSAKQMDYRTFAMVAYEYAFNTLEDKLGNSIDKYPRYISEKGRPIEFDGVMETNSRIIVFELKTTLRLVMPARQLIKPISRVVEEALELGRHKKKPVEVRLIYVAFEQYLFKNKERLQSLEQDLRSEFGSKHFSADVMSYSDIGLGAFANEMRSAKQANKLMQLTAEAAAD